MNVVSVPKEQYGNFYKGDSYIVLSVSVANLSIPGCYIAHKR